jgi:cation:H+ antiporter
MLLPILSIIGGLILLAFGAEGLVRGSSAIALRLGTAPLVVGLTIVAFGTGTPELVVSISAALNGSSSIALGNVVGSNISNIALILGVAALVKPMTVRAEVIKREVPIMIAVTAFLWLLLYDGELGRFDGAILTIGSIAYTFFTYKLSQQKEKRFVEEEFEEALPIPKKSVWLDAVFIISGLALLVIGANVLLGGAVTIAKEFGISEVVIGLTIIAIGTSLPELATSVLAAYKNEPDIAFGNAIGSNILNILAVLGLTALIQPVSAAEIRPLDLGVMFGSTILLFVLLGRNYLLARLEGVLLLIGFVIYIYTLLPQ